MFSLATGLIKHRDIGNKLPDNRKQRRSLMITGLGTIMLVLAYFALNLKVMVQDWIGDTVDKDSGIHVMPTSKELWYNRLENMFFGTFKALHFFEALYWTMNAVSNALSTPATSRPIRSRR